MCAFLPSLLFASDVAMGTQRLFQELTVSTYSKVGREEKEYFLSQPIIFLCPVLSHASQVPVTP